MHALMHRGAPTDGPIPLSAGFATGACALRDSASPLFAAPQQKVQYFLGHSCTRLIIPTIKTVHLHLGHDSVSI